MMRLVISSERERRHHPLPTTGTLRIGSADDNDLVITSAGVSRHHASLDRTTAGLVITDLGSKNGVIVAGRRVREAVVPPGENFRLGGASISVEEISTSDAEIALRLDQVTASSRLGVAEISASANLATSTGPAAALRWAREARKDSTDRMALLDRAREVLNASDLLIYTIDRNGDIALGAISGGTIPADADAELLASAADVRGESGPRIAGHWLVTGSSTRLAARLTKQKSASPWRHEFLDHVHALLVGDEGPARSTPAASAQFPPQMVLGASPAARRLHHEIAQIAPGEVDALILGETGVGKELVALAIHASGRSAAGPFLPINCAAIAPELLEAELFGIGRNVATGVDARPGLFSAADGGTVFLDEIGEMSPKLQAKLLRVVQEREVLAVGSSRQKRVHVRIISSTNRDLEALVQNGSFRADLYFRLRGAVIHVPPLRDRRADIPQMALSFASRAAASARKRIAGISRKALARILDHDWPGNVRELKLAVERAVLVCPAGSAIESHHLSLVTSMGSPASAPAHNLEDVERAAIVDALARTGGNKSEAARLLGVTRAGLYLKLRRYGLP